jgi:predicted signal transduction protein with EAL and GGDEF domain
VGDQLLLQVSQRLRESVRHVDHVVDGALEFRQPRSHRRFEGVGRLGGDEFIVLLPEIESTGAVERVAHRILESLRKPMTLAGHEVFVTASVGISLHPGDGDTVVDLLRHADMAMYAVKGDGRNGARIYDPGLSRRARERLEIESALHKALERGELRMRYQPTIDADRSRVLSAEALMRWHRDDRVMMPADFIPVAEDSGLIVPMTEWALQEVAHQVRVAVNMPPRMLRRPSVVPLIERVCREAGVPTDSLSLEITETTLLEGVEEVMDVLGSLKSLGVETSIDDFGTGYSSLVHFTRKPIGELKVDRDFVQGLGHDMRREGVVAAVIAMARALDLRVVAEGVETEQQFDILRDLGCHRMQGFLFAEALEPSAFRAFMLDCLSRPEALWRTRH